MQIVPYLKVKNIWAMLFLICADALGRKCQTSFIAFYTLVSRGKKRQNDRPQSLWGSDTELLGSQITTAIVLHAVWKVTNIPICKCSLVMLLSAD